MDWDKVVSTMDQIPVEESLFLRRPQQSDAGAVSNLIQADRQHLRWYFLSHEAIDATSTGIWIDRLASHGVGGLLVVEESIVGYTSMHLVKGPEDETGELYYWIASDHQGNGLITKSCAALISVAFGQLELHRVMIRAARNNTRSRRIPERLGFTLEGYNREAQRLDDGRHDLAVYSLLQHEWDVSQREILRA